MQDHPADDWQAAEEQLAADYDDHHAQRDDFTKRLAATGEGLVKAGKEMAELKAACDDVARRMEALDRRMMSPATVRRATLNKVWDALVDAGNISGAHLVMKMISDGTGDWVDNDQVV